MILEDVEVKLREFLEEVEGVDPESELVFNLGVGCCGDHESLIENCLMTDPKGYVVFYFDSLPYLNSCRKLGAAMRNDKNG